MRPVPTRQKEDSLLNFSDVAMWPPASSPFARALLTHKLHAFPCSFRSPKDSGFPWIALQPPPKRLACSITQNSTSMMATSF